MRASFGGGCGRGEQAVEVRTGSVWEGSEEEKRGGRGGRGGACP